MQAIPHKEFIPEDFDDSPFLQEMVATAVPFSNERMNDALEDERIEKVEVFQLKRGMIISIAGGLYKVKYRTKDGTIKLKEVK